MFTQTEVRAIAHAAIATVPDSKRLYILNKLLAARVQHAHCRTRERFTFHQRIKQCAQGIEHVPHWARIEGITQYVALVRSGRDCDGVSYSGDVSYVPADWRTVDERIAHDLEWADGPMNHGICSPSVARKIPSQSRDLVMEAYEDGHPHYISEVNFDDVPY